jgi:hypothetical protein
MILRLWLLIILFIAGCGRNSSVSQNFQSAERVIGCNNILVYWLADDLQSYFQVFLDANKLELESVNIFEIAESNITVIYKQFDEDISITLCNDLRPNNIINPLSEITARSGKVKMNLTNEDLSLYKKGLPYVIELELIRVQFDDNILISRNLGKVDVGWMPG